MDWLQILTIIAANTTLFLWARNESRADYRHLETRTESILEAIRQDIKDFHGRLCAIEEKNKK